MRRSNIVTCILLAGAPAPLAASPLALSGNLRVRYEAIDNQLRVGFGNQDDLLNLRTILSATYDGGSRRAGHSVGAQLTAAGENEVLERAVYVAEGAHMPTQAIIAERVRSNTPPDGIRSLLVHRVIVNLD